MKKYKVKITETLERVIEVEADSENEAFKKADRMWQEEIVVLDSDDFVEKEIYVLKEEN